MQQGPIEFNCKRYPESNPHPEDQEAFSINAQLPWQRDFVTGVKVEVTTREAVLLPPLKKTIIHGYGESLDGAIYAYQLEEIIAEKIRAILQFSKKLHERGWGRSRVRDYYDLWRIFCAYGGKIDRAILPSLVAKKCDIKSVKFTKVEDLFEDRLMEYLNEWDRWLGPVVPNIPEKEKVIRELKIQISCCVAV